MRKFFRYLLIIVGIVLLIGLAGFSFIEIRGIPSYEVKKVDFTLKSTPESIARGKKIAMLLCADCHRDNATGKLTGHMMSEVPKEFGTIFSQNITQDKTYGIGDWTDGDLVYLLRTGIKKDGKYAPPYMAKLPHLSDEDMNAVISFLRSDDPLVTASATPDKPCEPSFVTKFLCAVAFKPFKMPEQKIDMPDTNNTVEFGRYLVYNLECFSCHSADYKTDNWEEPEKSKGYLGGGNKPLDREGKVMLTPNLTPDKETGIGEWTEQKFVNALKYGTVENQKSLRFPMVPYIYLTDTEAKAIYAYLKTIPAIKNSTPRTGIN
jgi:mono/diheme cytochrome c family protein